MAFKIGGFAAEYNDEKRQEQAYPVTLTTVVPKKSVVKVYFSSSGKKLFD